MVPLKARNGLHWWIMSRLSAYLTVKKDWVGLEVVRLCMCVVLTAISGFDYGVEVPIFEKNRPNSSKSDLPVEYNLRHYERVERQT